MYYSIRTKIIMWQWIGPIRNWPAPRMVWEEIVRQSNSWFNEKELTIIIGGDCSIIVGTAQRLHQRYKDNIHLTIVGHQSESKFEEGITAYQLSSVRMTGTDNVVDYILHGIPKESKILIHMDLDAIKKEELYAVYSPSEEGFTIDEITILLKQLLNDPRVVGIEFTEFFALYDPDRSQAMKVIEMITEFVKDRK